MLSLLKQPYPILWTSSFKLQAVFLNGILVSVFLWLFRPFDINSTPVSNLDLYILGFGPVTMIVSAVGVYIVPALYPDYFKESGWTVGKNIQYSLILVFIIGLGNLWYSNLFAGTEISLSTAFRFQFFTLAVTLFLATAGTFLNHHFKLKRFRKEAEDLNEGFTDRQQPEMQESVQTYTIVADNEKDELMVSEETLMFIESADNYCKIYRLVRDKVVSDMLRITLKNVESQLTASVFLRCHRSYLVNLKMVRSVSGNSQGLRLHLTHFSESVPVSRNMSKEVQDKIRGFVNQRQEIQV